MFYELCYSFVISLFCLIKVSNLQNDGIKGNLELIVLRLEVKNKKTDSKYKTGDN
jgi:hypothetical protein